MNTHVDKTQENKSQSVANSVVQKQSGNGSAFQFIDNRSEAVTQRKSQEIANNSSQVSQLRASQDIANNSGHAEQVAQLQPMVDNASSQQQEPTQKKENNTGLPDNLKTGMESLSGMSLDDVKVHRNSDKPAQLQAHAYAQGTDIHLGPGQEKHLPHEAWHVVQQKQGRVKPTMQMKGKVNVNVNDDVGLENEADVMGEKALRNQPKQKLSNTSIQKNSDSTFQLKIMIDEKEINDNEFASMTLGQSDEIIEYLTEWKKNTDEKKFRDTTAAILKAQHSAYQNVEDEEHFTEENGEALNEEHAIPQTFDESLAPLFKLGMGKMGNNWNTVKDHFKKSKKHQEPTPRIFINPATANGRMVSLLKYRRFITVDSDNPNSSMSKAKESLEGESPKGQNEDEKDYLEWDAAGSDDFTSDIDLNIMGRKSELASQYAFEFFRNDWEKESGEVFDVNFYARDWKPNNLGYGLKASNKNVGTKKSLNKSELAEAGTEFEGKGNAEDAKRLEKINSIAKLIRDMKDLPDEIKASVKQALGGDAGAKAAWDGGAQTVLDWETQVTATKIQGNSRAKSENLEYAKATNALATARTNLKGVTEEPLKSKLEGDLLAARLKAAFYGPEAYVTEASFIHGVINKQMQSRTFKARGKGGKKDTEHHKVNFELNNDELLQVVIENVGFAFHHINELSAADSETINMGYSAVAKYVYRACNAIKHMGVNDFAELSVKAKNTVLKKKGVDERTKDIDGKTISGGLTTLGSKEINTHLVNLLAKANEVSN
jgi:hypothetical protein